MKLVVQRVSKASVTVEGEIVGKINKGYMVLLGVKEGDTKKEADFLVNYFENGLDKEHIKKSAEKIFKTETGKKIVKEMFFLEAFQKSETWAQDALQDLEDFIEEQGIYIRQ